MLYRTLLLRKWIRFRLATLLLLTTVACFAVARVDYLADRRRETLALIAEAGGTVVYAHRSAKSEVHLSPIRKTWYRYWVPPVERIDIGLVRPDNSFAVKTKRFGPVRKGSTTASAEWIRNLRFFPELRSLCCSGVNVDLEACRALVRMPKLEELWVDNCNVTDRHVEILINGPSLEALSVYDAKQVTSETVEELATHAHLKAVMISGTSIVGAEADRLRELRPDLIVEGPRYLEPSTIRWHR